MVKYNRKSDVNDDVEKMRPSKSAKKRESLALQKMGQELASVSPQQRERMNLPQDLEDALQLYAKITDREGKRRQMQFIGRLLREEETDLITRIKKAFADKNAAAQQNIALFQKAEKYREKLLGCARDEIAERLNSLAKECREKKSADAMTSGMQELEALLEKARAENSATDGPRNYSRQLFRKIAEMLQ